MNNADALKQLDFFIGGMGQVQLLTSTKRRVELRISKGELERIVSIWGYTRIESDSSWTFNGLGLSRIGDERLLVFDPLGKIKIWCEDVTVLNRQDPHDLVDPTRLEK